MAQCEICKNEYGLNGLRLGVCWDCATAESIIDDGSDMRDQGPKGKTDKAKTAREKLEFLISVGWRMKGR